MPHRHAAILLFTGLALLSAGCGDDRGLIPVTGRVTLQGAAMPGRGDLTFVPKEVDAGFPRRPAKAEFDTDGSYSVRSFEPGDGLFPGTYQVGVHCWKVVPIPDGPPPQSYINARYQSPVRSGLVVEVPAGQATVEFNIDLEP